MFMYIRLVSIPVLNFADIFSALALLAAFSPSLQTPSFSRFVIVSGSVSIDYCMKMLCFGGAFLRISDIMFGLFIITVGDKMFAVIYGIVGYVNNTIQFSSAISVGLAFVLDIILVFDFTFSC